MSQESSSRQARFAFVKGCDVCVIPADRMGTLDFRAGKDVVKRGLDGGTRVEVNADRNLAFPRNVGVD